MLIISELDVGFFYSIHADTKLMRCIAVNRNSYLLYKNQCDIWYHLRLMFETHQRQKRKKANPLLHVQRHKSYLLYLYLQ